MTAFRLGIDIDGVLVSDILPQVPWAELKKDDWTALDWFRQNAIPLINLDSLLQALSEAYGKIEGYLVTGRPVTDRKVTEFWHSRFSSSDVQLVHNTFPVFGMDNSVLHKVQAYKDLNLNLFLESSEEQARQMSVLGCNVTTLQNVVVLGLRQLITRNLCKVNQ